MEKRPKKTRARTLSWDAHCAKLIFVATLFAPALFASKQFSEKATAVSAAKVKPVEVSEKPRPKELVRIYSIIKSHRPDIADAEIWNVSEVIWEESFKRKLDPLLVLALIQIESGFQHTAVSPSADLGYRRRRNLERLGSHLGGKFQAQARSPVGAGADSNRKRLPAHCSVAEWRARDHADHARHGQVAGQITRSRTRTAANCI